MRILHLIDSLSPGGAERMAVNISNSLSKSGYTIVLCCTRNGGSLEASLGKDVIFTCVQKNSFLDLNAFKNILYIVSKYKIEILHAHSTSIYWAIFLKIIYFKVKLIWHDHEGNSEHLKDNDRVSIKYLSFLINAIIAVNESLRVWSLKNTFVKAKNILFIRNYSHLQLSSIDNYTLGEKYRILCLANFRFQKDHFTLLEAIKILVNERSYSFITVTLAGLNFNDDYYKEVLNFISSNQLNNNVFILGSVIDICILLENTDMGVLSSNSEGLPVSLLEYGMAGLPVIITDVGQCAEVVGYGKLGTVVPPKDSLAFANAVEWHICHREESWEKGLLFKKHVQNEYGEEKFLSSYHQLLDNL
jgi:glycosyltransferase involved in cell wall biosynthesis